MEGSGNMGMKELYMMKCRDHMMFQSHHSLLGLEMGTN